MNALCIHVCPSVFLIHMDTQSIPPLISIYRYPCGYPMLISNQISMYRQMSLFYRSMLSRRLKKKFLGNVLLKLTPESYFLKIVSCAPFLHLWADLRFGGWKTFLWKYPSVPTHRNENRSENKQTAKTKLSKKMGLKCKFWDHSWRKILKIRA